MPIPVTCPSCHTRFNVSDKFAGQTGPCPKCKNSIKVPDKSDEVVIHAPDDFGPKDSTGAGTLKPIERKDATVSPVVVAAIVAACLATMVVAFVLGRMYTDSPTGVPVAIVAAGALLLGPPIAFAGYAVLRDSELEPHRGTALIVRALICGVIYAVLWGAYTLIVGFLFNGQVETFHLVFIAPLVLVAGGVAALACLELDFLSGVLHYGFYLVVTVIMRYLVGMSLY